MDKTEYSIKLDQINLLVEEQDFQGALEIVESIDWRRVKSIRTLCMVADIYEANDLLEESKEILILAYNRTSAGRGILYRLVETSLKLQQVDDAVDYYTEYVQIARDDNAQYLLKYKIYKARKAPIEDRIAILEEYKNREYTERWAYELAKLYDKAGMKEQCIEACDDLILWFSEGKYVLKAMDLKREHMTLSEVQEQQYAQVKTNVEAQAVLAAEQQRQMAETKQKQREEAKAMATIADEELLETTVDQNVSPEVADVQPLRQNAENIQERLASSFRDVFSGFSRIKNEIESDFSKEQEIDDALVEELEDMDDYQVVKELEPEQIENEPIQYEQPPVEPVEVPQPTVAPDLDLSKILEETANNIARQVGKAQNQQVETETPDREAEVVKEIQALDPDKTSEFNLEEQLSNMLKTAEKGDEPETEAVAEEVAVETPEEELETPEVAEIAETPETAAVSEVEEEAEVAAEPEPELSIEEQILQEETKQERRARILNDTRPTELTDEQKQLFSYFAKVPGMDQQLLEAMYGVYAYASDKTSKKGNIAIMGGAGTGKTQLSENLIKVLCKDLGLEAIKFARLNAAQLNEKDPAKVVAKLSGGFLLIEGAGAMTAETIDKLSYAMEFRTDSMIVVIEDEKNEMRSLLKEHEEFAQKFETVISIPVFTNDELISFARSYAKELNYKIDELGILALYTLIGEEQTEQEPIIINQVKEIVDNAIQKAQKGTRKFGRKLSSRGLDEEGRTILYEKDFDL